MSGVELDGLHTYRITAAAGECLWPLREADPSGELRAPWVTLEDCHNGRAKASRDEDYPSQHLRDLVQRCSEERSLRERESQLKGVQGAADEKTARFLELVSRPVLLYKTAFPEERRSMLEIMTSNLRVDVKNVDIAWALPFSIIAKRDNLPNGAPHRGAPRTLDSVVRQVAQHLMQHDSSDLDRLLAIADRCKAASGLMIQV